jgi:hypothetical protein
MSVCEALHVWANSLPALRFPFDVSRIPLNGIYVLFEQGEVAHGANRIVRVGTHTGNNQLPSRLCQHFLIEKKDRSIFRKNIGRALLNRDNDPFLPVWELDRTSRAVRNQHGGIDTDRQNAIEKAVSDYIRDHFSFVVFRVDDKVERLMLESKMISTVSLCDACPPSAQWLGQFSPKRKIRESGLWLVNELYKVTLSLRDLERLPAVLSRLDHPGRSARARRRSS